MECLSLLILLFASLPTPTTAPIITILSLLAWQVNRMKPCIFCATIMYIILVSVVLYEGPSESSTGGDGGLFDALRLSPVEMEMNLLLRVAYDPSLGVGRSPPSKSMVFGPVEGFGNFFKAFLRYLLEPSYGKIYRQ